MHVEPGSIRHSPSPEMICRRMVIKEGKVVPYERSGIEEAGLHPEDKGGLRPRQSSIGTTIVSNDP
jgi:hypothetical protein